MKDYPIAFVMALALFFAKEIYIFARKKFGKIDLNISKKTHDEAMGLVHKRISDTRDKVLCESKEHASGLFTRSEERLEASNELMLEKLDSNSKVFSARFDGLENLLKQVIALKNG